MIYRTPCVPDFQSPFDTMTAIKPKVFGQLSTRCFFPKMPVVGTDTLFFLFDVKKIEL